MINRAGVRTVSGLVCLIALNVMAAGPEFTLRAPRLSRGDELTYKGQVIEVGEQVQKRFRKEYGLELRLFVLEATPSHLDFALMTKLQPKIDPAVANSSTSLTGRDALQTSSAAVRLDLLRLDDQGRVLLLNPKTNTLPLPLQTASKLQLPPMPLDLPPSLETGMFVPLPAKPQSIGGTWMTLAEGRPPLKWNLREAKAWNGGQCLEIELLQQSEGWERSTGLMTSWRRVEQLLVSPSDGFTHKVSRRVERREGQSLIGWVEVSYEAEPITRRLGSRYNDVRREVELAYTLLEDLRTLTAKQGRISAMDHRTAMSKLDRFTETQPVPGPFSECLESVRRRWSAAARGELVQLPEMGQALPQQSFPKVGEHFPDFAVPRVGSLSTVQLASLRGKPCLLHFYRPGSTTAKDSLQVGEACQSYFKDTVQVLSLSIREEGAEPLQQQLKLQHALADGRAMKPRLEPPAWPMYVLLDRDGKVVWEFVGHGPETGFLIREELSERIGLPTPRNR